MRARFEVHSHTEFSNTQLPDSTNKVESLLDYAFEMGLAGISITDHGRLSGHIRAQKYQKEKFANTNFKLGLGNEIYLCDTRESGRKYYHFILIAKDAIGWKQLSILSSWAYFPAGTYRPITLKSDIEEVIQYLGSGHLIATTACIGGELSSLMNLYSKMIKSKAIEAESVKKQIVDFVLWGKKVFGEDFYIECAPGCSSEQIRVNQGLRELAVAAGVKMVIGTDSHYLRKEDRYAHKAFLNSKQGDREVDAFYEYSYLQTEEEIIEHLACSGFETSYVLEMFDNSMEIYDKIESLSTFDLQDDPKIPKVKVKTYPKKECSIVKDYPILSSMFISDDDVERYWVNECINKLIDIEKVQPDYLAELEEEADVKRVIGEKLNTNMFLYPITMQKYISKFWELGSTVGAGRGSACAALNHYLLGITQLDPIKWKFPFFRYLNRERVELGDIDIDIAPSRKAIILDEIKKERGADFADYPYIKEEERGHYGCSLIATFGTETSKSAVQTACRGYRSDEYKDGIDVDIAQYLSKLIPSERGFVWSLNDVVYGNPEKGRKPIELFRAEVFKYEGLLDIMMSIEGLISSTGSHASGVILFDEDPYAHCAFMRTPSGDIITQFDLHDCEYLSLVKYDFLVTEIQDKITQTIYLLQEYGEIEKELSLKEAYDKYLHPEVMSLTEADVWQSIQKNEVLNCFQFDSDIGAQATKKIQPKDILELTDANGLMRLMTSEPGEETPMEKYVRYKNNISLWYKEMDDFGLSKEQQKILEPYFLSSYGVPPSQEQLMLMLMDSKICSFSLKDANNARKIVGKKQMKKIPALKAQVLNQASDRRLGEYVWKYGVGPQMGYSFSVIHALSYSCIGYQSAFLATKWNPIYWNTSCLIVNSGTLDAASDASTDYAKLAKAIGDIRERGIKVSLIDINNSDFTFKPDTINNQIMFGMKALNGIGAPVIKAIMENRPYLSFKDFLNRCSVTKTSVISLIKAGAFDELEKGIGKDSGLNDRVALMIYYLSKVSEPKTKLNLQNFKTIIDRGLLPKDLSKYKALFAFNKALRVNKFEECYLLTSSMTQFFQDNYDEDILILLNNGHVGVPIKTWNKMYDENMDVIRRWIKDNQESLLQQINNQLFLETWKKYGNGNISSWEMESLCFYYHEHELDLADLKHYGIVNFFDLSESSEIERFVKRGNREFPIYKISRIAGTVIAKNDIRSSISLLTPEGVVSVKFTKDYYAMFARQLSETQEDGSKKVVEKGWFTRGTKLICTGYRRDDQFVSKKYAATGGHQLYKIVSVEKDGSLRIQDARYNIDGES